MGAPPDWTADNCPLSPRQLEVLRAVATVDDTQKVARNLHLSPSTVRKHLAAARQRLNCTSTIQAVVTAVRAGWV